MVGFTVARYLLRCRDPRLDLFHGFAVNNKVDQAGDAGALMPKQA